MHNYRIACAFLAAVAFSACASSTEPGSGDRLPSGTTVDASLTATDTIQVWSFAVSGASQVTVSLGVEGGDIMAWVTDSVSGDTLGVQGAFGPLQILHGLTIQAPVTGRVYLLQVRAFPVAGPRTIHARIEKIVFAPETRPAAFVVGDTVSGESLDPSSDVDIFTGTGQPGGTAIIVGEAPAPGSGRLALDALDSLTGASLATALVSAGQPPTGGFFPFTIPSNGKFFVRATTIGTTPAFHGAYRFWTRAVNLAPETLPAAAALNSEITGESLEYSGDIDDFTFTAPAGSEVNVFFQASRFRILEVRTQAGGHLGTATSAFVGTDTALFTHDTGRLTLPAGGTYVVRVTAGHPDSLDDIGPYRFLIYPINRAPEHAPAALIPGDTVNGESIDRPGDIDEFTFTGVAGQQFNAFVQNTASVNAAFQVTALDADGTLLAATTGLGTDSALLGRPVGRFVLQTTGTHRIRIEAANSHIRDAGTYRLLLVAVDSLPETRTATLVLGDSILGESIDYPGDLDVFTVVVPDSQSANLSIELLAGSLDPEVFVQLASVAEGGIIGATASQLNVAVHSGQFMLGPGTYTVRVDPSQYTERSRLRGAPYRAWLRTFNVGPETVGDTIAIGDTVTAEPIKKYGDTDRFVFFATKGQHINLLFHGQSGTGSLLATLLRPDAHPIVEIASPATGASLTGRQSARVDIFVTGWYTVFVNMSNVLENSTYQFALMNILATPEIASASLTAGDSVTSETIGTPGDWDEFIVTGTPGQKVSFIIDAPGVSGAQMIVRDAATGDSLAAAYGSTRNVTGPFIVPAGGQFRVSVAQPASPGVRDCFNATCGSYYTGTGPYKLVTVIVP